MKLVMTLISSYMPHQENWAHIFLRCYEIRVKITKNKKQMSADV